MGDVFYFIESIAVGLYIVIGILLVWNVRSFVLARGELRIAQFGLERELAQRRGGRALTAIFLAIELLLIVWAISMIAAPTWREGSPDNNLSQNPEAFRTSTPSVLGEFDPIPTSAPSGPDILSTAPPPSTPQGTIIAPGERIGCIRDQAWIEFPANGMLVFEPITVVGTANIDDFSFYRFEIKSDRPERNFGAIATDYVQPVIDGPLGQFLPQDYLEGEYRFRLVVFDVNATPVSLCEITIFISPPVPTETPIGSSVENPS